MSLEIFIGCFRNGEPSTFPRKLVEETFGPYTTSTKDDYWVLRFPDGGECGLDVAVEPNIDGFMVSRPTGSPELWKGLAEILKRTTSVLYWSGTPCVVADASVIPHLPPDMIESLGDPVVTTDRDRILELIRNGDQNDDEDDEDEEPDDE